MHDERAFAEPPNAYALLRPDFTIVAVNRSYIELVGRTSREIVGESILDAFPADPAESSEAVASFRRALRDAVDSVQRTCLSGLCYPIRTFHPDGAAFVHRWWDLVITPLCDADGAVEFLLLHTRDVMPDEPVTERR